MKAGVLALQGDFREHARVLADAGATPVEVRTAEQLAGVDCLVIPGGESTTMAKLARAGDLVEPVRERAAAGMPILGTCAGMIVLAEAGRRRRPAVRSVRHHGAAQRLWATGGFVRGGRGCRGIDHPVRGVFIRAPRVEDLGPDVRVLAEHEGHPVVLEQGNLLVASFHPELVGETGLHDYLLRKV